MLDEKASKTVHKDNECDEQTKMTLNEVKPVKNLNKNLQNFLDISLVQKEAFL